MQKLELMVAVSGKVLAGIVFGLLAKIIASNRAVITHHPGPDFTPCSLLIGAVLIFIYFYF